jgi:prepilin-type N-terminal cleavage/methylation domain-containing protein
MLKRILVEKNKSKNLGVSLKGQKGFTVLEMIAVVAMIGILSASTVPFYKQVYNDASHVHNLKKGPIS